MKKIIMAVIVAVIAATTAVFVMQQKISTPDPTLTKPLEPDANMDLLSIPEFTLTDQDGNPFTRDDLLGRITVLDFIFTNCPFICPPMSRNMKEAQETLAGSGTRFLSISVDPAHDTPERLREYAAEIGADTSTWTFLTGDAEVVRRMVTEGFLLSLDEDPSTPINLEGGKQMSNIAHPSRFILVGPDAEILAIYNGLDAEDIKLLEGRAAHAATVLLVEGNN